MAPQTGAQVIAQALHNLGVTVVFGLVGIPVVEIADEAIKLGIRFIAFRNEQAAGYAASAYGYLTGRPGVCLVVGGPGVLHAMAGVRMLYVVTGSLLIRFVDWQFNGELLPFASACRLVRNPSC